MKYLFSIFVLLAFAGLVRAQTADELTARAAAAVRAGNLADAIKDATAAIALDPKKGAAYRVRGHAHLRLVEKEERPAWMPPLDKRFPKSANAENALADFGKAIELDPNDAVAIAFRGSVHWFLNDLETALAAYKLAGEMVPSEPWFKATYQNAKKRLATQYSIAAGERRNSAKRVTTEEERQKIIRDALVLHNKSIELDPSADNYSSRAFTLEELDEYEKAAADLTEYLKFKSDEYLTYYRRGRLYHNLKRYADAVADYRKGLEIVERLTGDISLPQNDFRTEIARNLALLGKFDEAFSMFDLALGVSRPSYITHYERGKAYLLKGDLEKAEADFRRAIELGRGYQPAADELRKMGKTP